MAQRSVGVSFVGGLTIALGIGLLLLIIRDVIQGPQGVWHPDMTPGLRAMQAVVGATVLIWIGLGIGLLGLREWARRAFIGFLGCSMVFGSVIIWLLFQPVFHGPIPLTSWLTLTAKNGLPVYVHVIGWLAAYLI